MTKPVILNPNKQETNKRQTIVSFSGKILKFCLRIKTLLQMLEKGGLFFAKFRTIILNIAEIDNSLALISTTGLGRKATIKRKDET